MYLVGIRDIHVVNELETCSLGYSDGVDDGQNYSQFCSRFTPGFGPDSESIRITRNHKENAQSLLFVQEL